MKLKPVDSRTKLQLRDRDAFRPKKAPSDGALEDALREEAKRISQLQTLLWADGRYALLIVLQGRDASGKDGTIKHVFKAVLEERADDMAFFDERVEKGAVARLESIVGSEFARMEYAEAVRVLEASKEKFEFPVKWGVDLQSEHERYLTEKHAKKPVIVMNYPKAIKAFYMRQNDDGKTVAAMDVLAPGIGEIVGGSQREERLDRLDARMAEVGIDKESLGWYRDLRRYGSVPHAGFGLGFERTVAYATGLSNVRDAIPFPRTPGNARY